MGSINSKAFSILDVSQERRRQLKYIFSFIFLSASFYFLFRGVFSHQTANRKFLLDKLRGEKNNLE